MLVLITYDVRTETVSGRKRLNKIARVCSNYGQRVQNSVFECSIDASQLIVLKHKLLEIYNEKEDSLRFYNLGNNYKQKIEHFGAKETYDPEDVLIV